MTFIPPTDTREAGLALLAIVRAFRRGNERMELTCRRLLMNALLRETHGNVRAAHRLSGMNISNILWHHGARDRMTDKDLDPDVEPMRRRCRVSALEFEPKIVALIERAGHSMTTADITEALLAGEPDGILWETRSAGMAITDILRRSKVLERDPVYRHHWRVRERPRLGPRLVGVLLLLLAGLPGMVGATDVLATPRREYGAYPSLRVVSLHVELGDYTKAYWIGYDGNFGGGWVGHYTTSDVCRLRCGPRNRCKFVCRPPLYSVDAPAHWTATTRFWVRACPRLSAGPDDPAGGCDKKHYEANVTCQADPTAGPQGCPCWLFRRDQPCDDVPS